MITSWKYSMMHTESVRHLIRTQSLSLFYSAPSSSAAASTSAERLMTARLCARSLRGCVQHVLHPPLLPLHTDWDGRGGVGASDVCEGVSARKSWEGLAKSLTWSTCVCVCVGVRMCVRVCLGVCVCKPYVCVNPDVCLAAEKGSAGENGETGLCAGRGHGRHMSAQGNEEMNRSEWEEGAWCRVSIWRDADALCGTYGRSLPVGAAERKIQNFSERVQITGFMSHRRRLLHRSLL